MIKLSANLSDGLVALIRSKSIHIDGVEVGPYLSLGQIENYRQQLPDCTFFFHHGNLLPRLRWIPGTAGRLQVYLRCTQSPWLSFHYSLIPPGYAWLGAKAGLYLPPPDIKVSAGWSVGAIEELKEYHLPLLLENMPAFSTRKYAFETAAENIVDVLTKTNVDLLLDIAHTRSVASVFGLDVHDYIESLPLERVRQVHVSGPRLKNGHLYDAHDEMLEEDYALLKWVLMRTKPEIVALEYFRDKDALRRQLTRIEEIIHAV
jgi:hypothetical protein